MNAKFDADNAVIYPACLGCKYYDEAVKGYPEESFCETGFQGNCPRKYRRRNAQDTNA